MLNRSIYFSERNIHGGWTIFGQIGVKQYYGYTKAEAEAAYRAECLRTIVKNTKSKTIGGVTHAADC